MSEQPGRYQRSARGMVGAMLVLLLVVFGFVVLRALNRTELDKPVRSVEWRKTLAYAHSRADFPVLAPVSLPSGWRATSARFVPEPVRWHLGILTDEERYVGLEQSRKPLQTMVETYVDRNVARGPVVRVGGTPWRSWSDSGGDTALTRVQGGVTTLVVTSGGKDVLVRFAGSLRPRAASGG